VNRIRDRWIETESGEHVPFFESCSFGRAQGNTIIVASEKASRRHALIHLSDDSVALLVDLGSSNGTYLNGHRVRNLVELNDGDILTIGSRTFVFREEVLKVTPMSDLTVSPATEQTGVEQCWMLVADTESPSVQCAETEADGFMKTVEGWAIQAQRIISKYEGMVSTHWGEGLLAYWIEENGAVRAKVVKAVESLHALSQRQRKPFRMALHFGEAALRLGATPAPTLGSRAMMQVIQMQKRVWTLPVPIILSEPAARKLGSLASLAPVGDFVPEDGKGEDELYTMLVHETDNAVASVGRPQI
jgi:FHA domain